MLKLWGRVLLADNTVFDDEKSKATSWKTVLGVAIYTLLQVILLEAFYHRKVVLSSVEVAVVVTVVPLSFYMLNGVIYITARVFGGKGDFVEQAYLHSLVLVPIGMLNLVTVVLSAFVFPQETVVGLIVTIMLAIYMLVLQVRIVKVVHRYSFAQSVLAVFSPFVMISPCLCVALADWSLSGWLERLLFVR